MLKKHLTIIIICACLSACNTLSERSNVTSSEEAGSAATSTPQEAITTSAVPSESSGKKETQESASGIPLAEKHTDVWVRIRDQLTLNRHLSDKTVKARIAWYARHQAYLDRVAERATPYLFHIVEEIERRGMPMELALLPIVESAFHPFAYSRSHASGIWQFIPGTGRNYGLKQNWWYDGRRDIVAATDAALRYLDKLNKEFHGNWLHALAAYNTGERNVGRAIKRNRKAGKQTDFWSLRLPRETRGYVPSLLAVAELLAEPEKYGITWQTIENKPYFTQVDIGGQLDLATAAGLADLSMDDLYTLNPAFNRWATAPDGPHHLLVPVGKKERFISGLNKLPESERITWKRHVIKRGENLGQIARDYHTSVSALKQSNKLRSNLIREGHSLLIPSSKQPLKHYTLSLDSRRYRGLKQTGKGKSYIYTVRRGDTLWDIGRQYGVSIKQLCAWNGINSRSVLRPGKKLNLHLAEKDTAKAVPARFDQATASSSNYIVKKGDSLWLIAKRFKVSVKQLRQWNKLGNGKYLRPGQELILKSPDSSLTGV